MSSGEDTSSFSQCQQEQEARRVLRVVTRLICALARGPSRSQSPVACSPSALVQRLATNDEIAAFGGTVLNGSKAPCDVCEIDFASSFLAIKWDSIMFRNSLRMRKVRFLCLRLQTRGSTFSFSSFSSNPLLWSPKKI